MFYISNKIEHRKITISSLLTCIYLPSLVTIVSFNGMLYTVGNGSSLYVLVLIFIAELFKSFYLNSNKDVQAKKLKGGYFKVSDIAKSLAFLFGVMFCFFVGTVLFGAPFLDCHEETLMLSSLLTLLTIFPLTAHCGVESSMQLLFGLRTYEKDTIHDMLVRNVILTLCGAWLGAVVIPLDWNTPWQKWPIPCYLGALGGYILSNVLTILKLTMISASNKYPVLNIIVNMINKLQTSK